MNKKFAKDAFFWGFILWFIGYLLGIFLFFLVPKGLIGWIITPLGIVIALWVLGKKVRGNSFGYYFRLATAWTLLAVVLDYIFNVQLFNIGGAYYQIDVYLYYLITFLLPIFYWHMKKRPN